MGTREQLTELIDEEAPGRLSSPIAVLLLSAPFLLVLGVELTTRSPMQAGLELRLPWMQEVQPNAPLSTVALPARGDLMRMARLPHYDERFAERAAGTAHTDESGYRNPPSGQDDPFRQAARDITLVGASFMVTGEFAESLAEHSGLELYNAAWEGRGAVFPVLHLLDEDRIGRAGERFLVYGVVQRSLSQNRGWHHLAACLDEAGNYHGPATSSTLRAQALDWLRWNQRLDDFLLKTSAAAVSAGRLAPYLPPMALDLGATSAVRLARLAAPWDRPMLVLAETIDSLGQGFEQRVGPTILVGLRRLDAHCTARGVRLVMVLVPDKLQVYLDHITPVNFRFDGEVLRGEQAATSVFARALEQAGIATVDLLPHFQRSLAEEERLGRVTDPLLYREDDTHWTERGSRLAGEVVAERILR